MIIGPENSLVSVDPGKTECGWAYFESGVLHSCGLGRFVPADHRRSPAHVVIELPQIYRQSKMKGDPNDLIDLAFAAGIFVSQLQTGAAYETVRPREWKGTRPKHVCNKITLAALTNTEKALLPDLSASRLHNVVDAIGIGLWKLKRR